MQNYFMIETRINGVLNEREPYIVGSCLGEPLEITIHPMTDEEKQPYLDEIEHKEERTRRLREERSQ